MFSDKAGHKQTKGNNTMSTFQTVEQVLESTSTFDLLEHCKESVIENNQSNNGSFSDWTGADITETYLSFNGEENEFIANNPDERDILVKSLDDWLAKQ